jgi:hypothetical protein
MTTPISHDTRYDSYTATDSTGRPVATAHIVGVPDDTWSIKILGDFYGLAPSRDLAIRHLQRIAALAD